MTYQLTPKMGLPKPVKGTMEQFDITKYGEMLDKIDTLAGVTPVDNAGMRPTTNLYDGRAIYQKDNKNTYYWNATTSLWEQAVMTYSNPGSVPSMTTAQRYTLDYSTLADCSIIYNTTTNTFEIYRAALKAWSVYNVDSTFSMPDYSGTVKAPLASKPSGATSFTALRTCPSVGQQLNYAWGSFPLGAVYYKASRQADKCTNGAVVYMANDYASGTGATSLNMPRLFASDTTGQNFASASVTIPANTPNYTGGGNTPAKYYMCTDQDDNVHVAFTDISASSNWYYVFGTPNAARTQWTWSSPALTIGSNSYVITDIAAFRQNPNDKTAGYQVILGAVYQQTAASGGGPMFTRISVTSAGVATTSQGLTIASPTINQNYSSNSPLPTSVTFEHNGDGKTPLSVNAPFYLTYGTTDQGYITNTPSVRKFTYAGSSYTGGAEVPIGPTSAATGNFRYYTVSDFNKVIWDGTQVVLVGSGMQLPTTNTGQMYWFVAEYDSNLNPTTVTYIPSPTPSGQVSSTFYQAYSSFQSVAADSAGNLYILALGYWPNQSAISPESYKFKMYVWNKATKRLSSGIDLGIPTTNISGSYATMTSGFQYTNALEIVLAINQPTGAAAGTSTSIREMTFS